MMARPHVWDTLLQILWERGSAHEQRYVEHLTNSGYDVVRIDGVDVTADAVEQTCAAMRAGASIIVQGALTDGRWHGRADILRRVEHPSSLGAWSYEPIDTKLARETRAGAVLQLCLYSDLLVTTQGIPPETMYVVAPWSEFEPQAFRYAEFAAYFRRVKRMMVEDVDREAVAETYPDPIEHCEICRWHDTCDKRRRDDDHLCLVANISKLQINELQQHGVKTLEALALLPMPLEWKPERGSAQSYLRIREQARLQAEARASAEPMFELLPVVPGLGLAALPEPSPGDIFLDLEGDPFVGEHGLEYFFGYQFNADDGESVYRSHWAFTREDEKTAFETFVDFVMTRWKEFPDLHIYHYAPYEPAALKRLMGRYATREEEIDQMLRAGRFVDLFSVVRNGVRASVESYSIKKMETFYGYDRSVLLTDANIALTRLQSSLELDDVPSIPDDVRVIVAGYNQDDCRSAACLRDWLEGLRSKLVAEGVVIGRPSAGDGSPNEKINEWLIKIGALIELLTQNVSADPIERTQEQQARWVLANLLDFHRREQKAVWWEHFRLAALPAEDLLDERAGLAGLKFVGAWGGTAAAPIHRYSFPAQETDLRGGEELRNVGGNKLGSIDTISLDGRTVDIKKRKDSAGIHPDAVYAHKVVDAQVMADSLVRLAEYVIAHGMEGEGAHQAARDLLLKLPPRLGGQLVRTPGETTLDAAIRLTGHLTTGVLPIQGPPGAGKTFTASQMICEFVKQGKAVGITANSHKVVRNVIDQTIKTAGQLGVAVKCCHKAAEIEPNQPQLTFAKTSEELVQALHRSVNVGGGTAWLWSRADAFETLDVLFVDEAAQMSLANVLAVSQAAKTIVLIGDPQQLDQPMQGSHPDGTDVSALDHLFGGAPTIEPDKGLFLEETWRLHPDICIFTSELFYGNRLRSHQGLDLQVIRSEGVIRGAGLRYMPVAHTGNQNASPEEAVAVAKLVKAVLAHGATWVDRDGIEKPVSLDDFVIITPYNAQVFELQQQLPGAKIGTVDKFQGQEAPIAIYSTATSSHADAPRGLEFLYSLNRFNVATSRAKCVSILVGSPKLFEAECRTPRHIQLVNAFCRFLELAELIKLPA
jgi:predicted RecB family nuclease